MNEEEITRQTGPVDHPTTEPQFRSDELWFEFFGRAQARLQGKCVDDKARRGHLVSIAIRSGIACTK